MADKDELLPQTVTYNEKNYIITKEGLAEILKDSSKVKATPPGGLAGGDAVFYNPIQQFNRDLSVLAIRTFAEDWDMIQKAKAERAKSRGKAKDEEQPAIDAVLQNNNIPDEASLSTESITPKRKRADGAEEGQGATKRTKVQDKERTDGLEHVQGQNGAPATSSLLPSATPTAPKTQQKAQFRILDALSASGLRALRYAKEIDQVTMVTANDLSTAAVESIKVNVRHNNLLGKVHAITGDAKLHMNAGGGHGFILPDGSRGKYHVVDLDPYGTAAPFLDAAVQSVQDGGLLCITCTDAAIFASVGYLEKTYAQYGGLPIKGPHSHEGGLRLILHAIATSAARYGLAIEPLLSLSIDFYARVFVRIRKSPSEVKLLPGKTIEVFGCDRGCGAWSIQPLVRTQGKLDARGGPVFHFSASQAPLTGPYCAHCGFKTHMAGPMWGGYLHNPFFVQRMIDLLPALDENVYGTIPRMEGMLMTARDEMLLPPSLLKGKPESETPDIGAQDREEPFERLSPDLLDCFPFFVDVSALSKVLHCQQPSAANVRSALIKLGYRVTRSHARAGSIRTDAPWAAIWEVMREWVRQRAPLQKPPKEGTAGRGIMRHDRSNGELLSFVDELTSIARQSSDIADAQRRIQALLWQLEHVKTEENERADKPKIAIRENSSDGRAPSPGHARELSRDTIRQLEVEFDEELGKERESKPLVRYQQNPRTAWGPIRRAR